MKIVLLSYLDKKSFSTRMNVNSFQDREYGNQCQVIAKNLQVIVKNWQSLASIAHVMVKYWPSQVLEIQA